MKIIVSKFDLANVCYDLQFTGNLPVDVEVGSIAVTSLPDDKYEVEPTFCMKSTTEGERK